MMVTSIGVRRRRGRTIPISLLVGVNVVNSEGNAGDFGGDIGCMGAGIAGFEFDLGDSPNFFSAPETWATTTCGPQLYRIALEDRSTPLAHAVYLRDAGGGLLRFATHRQRDRGEVVWH